MKLCLFERILSVLAAIVPGFLILKIVQVFILAQHGIVYDTGARKIVEWGVFSAPSPVPENHVYYGALSPVQRLTGGVLERIDDLSFWNDIAVRRHQKFC